MAITPVHAVKTVTTAATRIQLETNANIRPASVYIEAAAANTGYIYVGLVTVSSAVYISRLAAGEGLSLAAPDAEGRAGGTGLQLSSLYADSSASGDKLQLTYIHSQG